MSVDDERIWRAKKLLARIMRFNTDVNELIQADHCRGSRAYLSMYKTLWAEAKEVLGSEPPVSDTTTETPDRATFAALKLLGGQLQVIVASESEKELDI